MKPVRIFISGVSGTGKTKLAKHIESKYGIPFISTSGKALWREFNIRSHQDLILQSIKDPEFALRYQERLLAYREEVLNGQVSFVSDRGPLDNLLYFSMQVAPHVDNSVSYNYSEKCFLMQQRYCDIQIFLELSRDIPLEDDGMRVTSRLYQKGMNAIINDIIQTHERFFSVSIRKINIWDWERRIEIVENILFDFNLPSDVL